MCFDQIPHHPSPLLAGTHGGERSNGARRPFPTTVPDPSRVAARRSIPRPIGHRTPRHPNRRQTVLVGYGTCWDVTLDIVVLVRPIAQPLLVLAFPCRSQPSFTPHGARPIPTLRHPPPSNSAFPPNAGPRKFRRCARLPDRTTAVSLDHLRFIRVASASRCRPLVHSALQPSSQGWRGRARDCGVPPRPSPAARDARRTLSRDPQKALRSARGSVRSPAAQAVPAGTALTDLRRVPNHHHPHPLAGCRHSPSHPAPPMAGRRRSHHHRSFPKPSAPRAPAPISINHPACEVHLAHLP
jgi:hypothetical protein